MFSFFKQLRHLSGKYKKSWLGIIVDCVDYAFYNNELMNYYQQASNPHPDYCQSEKCICHSCNHKDNCEKSNQCISGDRCVGIYKFGTNPVKYCVGFCKDDNLCRDCEV